VSDYIHRFVPPASPAAPTILALHGTGGDENDLLPLARMISPEAGVLSPRGNVLENGMPRFFRRIAEGVFDLEDLRIRTAELARFLSAAAARYKFDRARVVALGYSNGANIAASLLLSEKDAFKGAILLRAMVPFEPQSPPSLKGTSVLISAGRQDPMIPQDSTGRLATLLRQAGADVTLSWHETGHGLVPREMEEASRWFGERVG
jgi:predicted esterase